MWVGEEKEENKSTMASSPTSSSLIPSISTPLITD